MGYDPGTGAVTTLGPLTLTYDAAGNVAQVADSAAKSSVRYQRDSSAIVIGKTTTLPDGTESSIHYSANGLLLDGRTNAPLYQQVQLPGGVSVLRTIAPGAAAAQSWSYPSINNNLMLVADGAGVPSSKAPTLFDPFGQRLSTGGAAAAPVGLQTGFQATGGYQTEALSIDVTLMGRACTSPRWAASCRWTHKPAARPTTMTTPARTPSTPLTAPARPPGGSGCWRLRPGWWCRC